MDSFFFTTDFVSRVLSLDKKNREDIPSIVVNVDSYIIEQLQRLGK